MHTFVMSSLGGGKEGGGVLRNIYSTNKASSNDVLVQVCRTCDTTGSFGPRQYTCTLPSFERTSNKALIPIHLQRLPRTCPAFLFASPPPQSLPPARRRMTSARVRERASLLLLVITPMTDTTRLLPCYSQFLLKGRVFKAVLFL